MFCDNTTITVSGGRGGDGLLSFRREKFRPRGGPDGGDGGKGGDIVFQVKEDLNTLTDFRRQKDFAGEDGENGGKNRKTGKSGKDLLLYVPCGTLIYDVSDHLIVDLKNKGQKVAVASGGKGGFGNAHYVSPAKRAPVFVRKGQGGESKKLRLELRCIADVGLAGLPNSGKSTLLSVLTHAKPKIAAYPFSTTEPVLGVGEYKRKRLIFADIPGIIKGASRGKGLGTDFLKHILRCKIVLYLVDCTTDNPKQELQALKKEIESFNRKILQKPKIVVLTKSDLVSGRTPKKITSFIKNNQKNKIDTVLISAVAHKGLNELQEEILVILSKTE